MKFHQSAAIYTLLGLTLLVHQVIITQKQPISFKNVQFFSRIFIDFQSNYNLIVIIISKKLPINV